jgi:ferredoxin
MRSATTRDKFDDYDRLERQPVPTLPVERRIGFTEVETGYDREAAITEGSRCLKCYISPVFDSEKCVLCGGCADVCPHGCLKLVSLDRLKGDETLARLMETRYGFSKSRLPSDYALGGAIVKDEDLCIRCGLCAERCPTGAITMEQIDVI